MVRVAIVGLGNMGGDHARRIHAGTVEGMTLAAVCDINPAKITRCLDEIIKDPSFLRLKTRMLFLPIRSFMTV